MPTTAFNDSNRYISIVPSCSRRSNMYSRFAVVCEPDRLSLKAQIAVGGAERKLIACQRLTILKDQYFSWRDLRPYFVICERSCHDNGNPIGWFS